MTLDHWTRMWDAASVRWGVVLVHFMWQGALIAVALWLARLGLRRGSAAARHALFVAGLAALASAPVVTSLWLDAQDDSTRSTALSTAPSTTMAPTAVDLGVPPSTSNSTAASVAPGEPHSPGSHGTPRRPVDPRVVGLAGAEPAWRGAARLGILLHLLAAIALQARLLVGLRGGRELVRRAEPITTPGLLAALSRQGRRLGMRALPQLARSAEVAVPTLVGLVRPAILLPVSFASGATLVELESILAHELAHLRRQDHVINIAQRIVESVLFFHPAVWWVSRQIRLEREQACDDAAVSLGIGPLDYARSLLRVAELAGLSAAACSPLVVLHAARSPSELRRRVARLLGETSAPSLRLASPWLWSLPVVTTLTLLPLLMSAVAQTPGGGPGAAAQAGTDDPNGDAKVDEIPWGEPNNGVRARIRLVAADTDEQQPDFAGARIAPVSGDVEQLTLLIELQNVSDQPLVLQGVRYGDSITPPWPGKSNSDSFAPYLFVPKFFDREGRPVESVTRESNNADSMMMLSGGLGESVAPGKSLVLLLRPGRWDPGTARRLADGTHRLRIAYQGTPPAARAKIAEHWPDKTVARAWSGEAVSNELAFQVAGRRRAALVWGEPVRGVRAAVELVPPAPIELGEDGMLELPHGARVKTLAHFQNVGEQPISLYSEGFRQGDQATLVSPDGKVTELRGSFYTGMSPMWHWVLQPGQVATVPMIPLGIAADEAGAEQILKPVGPIVIGPPDEYELRFQLRTDGVRMKTPDGVEIPGAGDYRESLAAGPIHFRIRERRPEDDPPTISTRLRFEAPDGRPIDKGQLVVSQQATGKVLFEGELDRQELELPKVEPAESLRVDLRTHGFEETIFYDVRPSAAEPVVLRPPVAQVCRLRLVDRQGEPVAGAQVRYFNRSKRDASVGPYPLKGREGPVWATSGADGVVRLDMLQRQDPHDNKLGDNIYWFYIEPPGLAPLFIGPVVAGDDLGDVEVGPLLEASGEIRGTPAQLDLFAAEWDQPAPMLRGNGESSWLYAESQRLETRREGDKLTFHLTGLRPGPLRIIARFSREGKPVSHVYTRREPNEDDRVYEFQLKDSQHDLVVTAK